MTEFRAFITYRCPNSQTRAVLFCLTYPLNLVQFAGKGLLHNFGNKIVANNVIITVFTFHSFRLLLLVIAPQLSTVHRHRARQMLNRIQERQKKKKKRNVPGAFGIDVMRSECYAKGHTCFITGSTRLKLK